MTSRVLLDTSLILTVLNEEQSIHRLLSSIERQTMLPASVIVCDGGSSDSTVGLLRDWAPPDGVHLQVTQLPGANISRGRNEAIRLATTRYVAITDAGTELNAEWLESLHRALLEGADVASGFFESTGVGFTEQVIARTITPLLGEVKPSCFLPSSRSVAITRASWLAAGMYPEWLDYCEDLVFDIALKARGASFTFVPNARASWAGRPSLGSFAKQYYRYARGDGKAKLWRKRHGLRYGAYGLGLVLLGVSNRGYLAKAVLLLGFAAYVRTPYRRVGVLMKQQRVRDRLRTAAFVPIIVIVGDLSKMAGYPVGVIWGFKHRPGTRTDQGALDTNKG